MCSFDLEPCDVWTETARTARKEHCCSVCGGRIAPGERYTTHFSKSDGGVSSERICGACYTARAEFASAHGEMVPNPSAFEDVLRECIAEDEESEQRWKPMLAAIEGRRHGGTSA